MAVVILEEQSFTFEDSVPNPTYDFKFSDGTVSNGYAKYICIDQIRVTQELLDGLLLVGLIPKVKVGQSIAGFEYCVGFQKTASRGTASGTHQAFIDLGDQLFPNLFGKSSYLEEAKIQLEVTRIVCEVLSLHHRCPAIQPGANGCGQSFEITPAGKSVILKPGEHQANRFEVITTMDDNWINHWCSKSSKWTISVAVKLVLSGIIETDPLIQDLLAANGRMLNDDVLADTQVIAQNGEQIMFHRSFLAANSPVFERMFHTKMQGTTFEILELLLPHMTEESVKALKEYLYVRGLTAPEENSLVCVELFQAGHKYGISTLEKATSNILLRMGGDWYSAAAALRLFLLVKDIGLPRLKQKAVEILKLKRVELKSLDEYRDLFRKENAAVAMELTESLASP